MLSWRSDYLKKKKNLLVYEFINCKCRSTVGIYTKDTQEKIYSKNIQSWKKKLFGWPAQFGLATHVGLTRELGFDIQCYSTVKWKTEPDTTAIDEHTTIQVHTSMEWNMTLQYSCISWFVEIARITIYCIWSHVEIDWRSRLPLWRKKQLLHVGFTTV